MNLLGVVRPSWSAMIRHWLAISHNLAALLQRAAHRPGDRPRKYWAIALDPKCRPFEVCINPAVRPYLVLNAERFAQAYAEQISDPRLRRLPTVGGIDQLTHAGDLLVNFTSWPHGAEQALRTAAQHHRVSGAERSGDDPELVRRRDVWYSKTVKSSRMLAPSAPGRPRLSTEVRYHFVRVGTGARVAQAP